jgi:hypothetical protein
MMERYLVILATALVALIGFTAALTARYVATQSLVEPAADIAVVVGAADRLSGAIRIPTISAEAPASFNAEPFWMFHEYLARTFPLVPK